MTTLFWNIRGMGKTARVRQLKELNSHENVEIVGIQQTIKQDFSNHELAALTHGKAFVWN